MTRINFLSATRLAIMATIVFAPAIGSSQTLNPTKIVIAQMMDDDKGMKGQGMKGHGMQSQGKSMGMEGHNMGGSSTQNMQTPGDCAGGQCGAMQGPGMQGQMAGPMGPGAMMGPQMMQMMMQARMMDLPTDHIDGRIAYLHAELKITEPQMSAWTEFANVMRTNAKRVEDAQKGLPQRTTATAADRLDDQERWLTVRLESVKALKPAYAKLYAALDDKQKKIANELIAPHMGIR
jgi:hypothetical protein